MEYGLFHRLDSPTDVARVKPSGHVGGQAPLRNNYASDTLPVKAYTGPLPEGESGVEFYTMAKPTTGTEITWTEPERR
jgi:hypothetical protein